MLNQDDTALVILSTWMWNLSDHTRSLLRYWFMRLVILLILTILSESLLPTKVIYTLNFERRYSRWMIHHWYFMSIVDPMSIQGAKTPHTRTLFPDMAWQIHLKILQRVSIFIYIIIRYLRNWLSSLMFFCSNISLLISYSMEYLSAMVSKNNHYLDQQNESIALMIPQDFKSF